VRVTIQLPALQIIEDDGDIIGHSVNIKFQVQYNGGGFTDVINDTISGKTTNSYQRDYIIALTGAFPVDIRMVRVSPDESSARRQNRTFWFSCATQTAHCRSCGLTHGNSKTSQPANI
jgi:predicted phage tail protein